MKPEKPITRKEMYLDVATGGSTELPSPVTREEKYLAKIAGESVDIPTPVTRYEMLLAAVAGESYTLTPVTRLEIYLAKATGQDVEIPQPVTREEMYWFDYCGGTPTPPEREYTGAVPVTFVADGTPLLDYIISGNTVQNGTPTPDNPIMPQGTGERTGQIIEYPYFDKSGVISGVQWTISENGHIKGIGTTSSGTNFYFARNCFLKAGTYTLKIYGKHEGMILRIYDSRNATSIAAIQQSNTDSFVTFTLNSDTSNECRIYFNVGSTAIAVDIDCDIMLNSGSTALPYEPYGYKIPISSANTTTNVYLGEVETTRKIRKLVLTGEEAWSSYSGVVYLSNVIDYLKTDGIIVICTHYRSQSSVEGVSETEAGHITFSKGSNYRLCIRDSNYTTGTNFKSYLAAQYAAGTPVTVWYVLATPTTGIVNEPLMRIGDYADTLSMEQAGVEIPTASGSTTLDVATTVPPSEVYIKYRGEAVATLSALPAEVSSTEETPEEADPEETEETENGSEDVSLQHKPEVIE